MKQLIIIALVCLAATVNAQQFQGQPTAIDSGHMTATVVKATPIKFKTGASVHVTNLESMDHIADWMGKGKYQITVVDSTGRIVAHRMAADSVWHFPEPQDAQKAVSALFQVLVQAHYKR